MNNIFMNFWIVFGILGFATLMLWVFGFFKKDCMHVKVYNPSDKKEEQMDKDTNTIKAWYECPHCNKTHYLNIRYNNTEHFMIDVVKEMIESAIRTFEFDIHWRDINEKTTARTV